jgi:hypothetical protein
LAGCIGISVLIGAGGFLEITGCIRRPILFGIVLIGDALLAVAMWRDYHRIQDWVSNVWRLVRMNSAVALLLFLLIALSATRIAGNLEGRYFNRYDDLGGYLSFPAEMLQLGSLPSDPFSARRIESSLGGSYFLQTFMMLAGDARTIRFIDWGFGSVLFLAIVFAICRKLKLSIIATLALSLLTFVIPFRRLNTTMVVLPAALFSVLFLLELAPELDELHLWLRPALMGITASAISTLKSTYIAPAVLVCALYYLAEIATATKHRGSVFLQGAICALTAGFCLSP